MYIISNLAQYVYIQCVNFNNLLIIAPITVTNLQTCISGQHFLPRKLIEVKDSQQQIILTRFLPRNSNLFVLLFWNALTSPVHLTYCLLEGFTGFFLYWNICQKKLVCSIFQHLKSSKNTKINYLYQFTSKSNLKNITALSSHFSVLYRKFNYILHM